MKGDTGASPTGAVRRWKGRGLEQQLDSHSAAAPHRRQSAHEGSERSASAPSAEMRRDAGAAREGLEQRPPDFEGCQRQELEHMQQRKRVGEVVTEWRVRD